MKTLLFLFILDFSGSMYQKMQEGDKSKEKYIILQENLSALMTSTNQDVENSNTGLLVFGTEPKKLCEDIKYSETPTSEVAKKVNKILPGAYSKTPLALSIDRGTDLTIEKKIKKIVIFSDGADTCGKDPCQQLEKSNDKLVKANYKMSIKFIGINLKKDDPKFECFRNGKFSNIDIDYTNIGDPFEVQNALRDGNETTLKQIKAPYGIIQVKGAPPTAEFKVVAQKVKHNIAKDRLKWLGAYRNSLKEGEYLISVNIPNTKKLNILVNANSEKQIYWSEFFKSAYADMNYQNTKLSFLFTPSPQTKEAHSQVLSFIVSGSLEPKYEIINKKIQFGEWSVKVISPEWLAAESSDVKVSFKSGETVQTQLEKYFEFEWVDVPNSARKYAFYFAGQPETLYLIQDGSLKIPIPKGRRVVWLNQ